MGRSWWSLWKLLGAAAVLALVRSCEGSSSHLLQYLYVGVSEPVQWLPQFISVGYIDGQQFVQYNSNTKKLLPQVSWIKEAEKEDPHYWKRNTQNAQETELAFRESINILSSRYNWTGGLQTWQLMSGCELRGDGSTEGYYQDGYNGRDFVAFDKETLTWNAADAKAQVTKRKWDANMNWNQHLKSYLDEECIEELQTYLRYGKDTLQRKEPPKIKVTSRADYDNMETLICRADGFYPKDIEVVWIRDGEVWEQETLRGLVSPNSDGTFHTWSSIKIDPKDRGRFQCRVDHGSLEKPVDFAVEESDSAFKLIASSLALGLALLVALTIMLFLIRKKRQDGYKSALTLDKGSSSSTQGSNKPIYLHP